MPVSGTKALEDRNFVAGNSSLIDGSANTVTKVAAFGYGVVLTGAAAVDAVTSTNTVSRYCYLAGCACAAVGTVSTGISVFNNAVGVEPVGLMITIVGSL